MYHTRNATVRDLRYNFKRVERMLAEGEPIQITKRKKVIATMTPVAAKPPRPDFIGRMRKIYGDKMLATTGADIVRGDRDA
jgi:antitoxin (DNA-binding transcriptional repressor) of toxin-antitoxin stability system